VRFGILEVSLFLLGVLFIRREIWQLHAATFNMAFWQEGLLIPLAALDGAMTGAYSHPRRRGTKVPFHKRFATPAFFFLYVGCAALSERLVAGVFPTATHEIVRTIGLVIVAAGMGVRLWAQNTKPGELERLDAAVEDGAIDATPPPRLIDATPPEIIDATPPPDPTAIDATPPRPGEADPQAITVNMEDDGGGDDGRDGRGDGGRGDGGRDDGRGDALASPSGTSQTPVTVPTSVPAIDTINGTGPHKLLRHPDAAGKLLSLIGLPLVFNSWLPLLALPGVIIILKWHITEVEDERTIQLGEPYLEYRKKTWNLIPYLY
jgi:protein-S-isoprenylcysteine O-methyltransferase Ste14